MTTTLIILGCIGWCAIGYFVNILCWKFNNFSMGFENKIDSDMVSISVKASIIFPCFIIATIVAVFSDKDRERFKISNNKFISKLADWHNRRSK